MRRHQASILDIAQTTGLSKSTVAYVLNGKYREMNIREETAAKVQQAAAAVGYQANFWAKSMGSRKSCMVGVLLPDLSGTFAQQIIKGVISELEPRNYEAFIGVSFWDKARERRELKLLLEKKVAGIIILPYAENRQYYEETIAGGCPITFISDYLPEVKAASAVTLDVFDAVEKIVNHLRDCDRNRVVMLGVDYLSHTLLAREEAFVTLLKNNDCNGTKVFKTVLADEISMGNEIVRILALKPRPDAILCQSDALAYRTLAVLAECGLKVPEDIMVIGIGNMDMSAHPLISLTTVDEPQEAMGRAAARMILERTENPNLPATHLQLQGKLEIRKTTSLNYKNFVTNGLNMFPTI